MEYSYAKRAILRGLSENSRESVTKLAELARCSRLTVKNNLEAIEKEFGIRYTLEFNEEALGIGYRHFIKINLDRPIDDEGLKIFDNDKVAQMVATTEGDFDLLVYAATPTGLAYISWETRLAMLLSEYGAEIRPSQVALFHIGFVELSNELLENINFRRLGLDDTDKKIVMLLNKNSRASFARIANETGINEDTARYRLERIKKAGIIKRFTISLEAPASFNRLAYFVNYKFSKNMEARGKLARNEYQTMDGDLPFVNTYQLLAPTTGAYRFFAVAIGPDREKVFEKGVMLQRNIFKEDFPSVAYAWIKKVIKGNLPIRNIDIKKAYNTVIWGSQPTN